MKTIVINPVGEPGSGKSTFSFWLTHELKMRGIRAEYVPEVIKYEFYSPEGIARVSSGAFDKRTLCRQHAMIQPLLGRVEVVINDGTLPSFYHYWSQRVPEDKLSVLRTLLDGYRQEQSLAEHRYLAVSRNHAYEAHGRFEDEASTLAMRAGLMSTLANEFGIVPVPVGDQADREAYTDRLVKEVLSLRSAPASSRLPRP